MTCSQTDYLSSVRTDDLFLDRKHILCMNRWTPLQTDELFPNIISILLTNYYDFSWAINIYVWYWFVETEIIFSSEDRTTLLEERRLINILMWASLASQLERRYYPQSPPTPPQGPLAPTWSVPYLVLILNVHFWVFVRLLKIIQIRKSLGRLDYDFKWWIILNCKTCGLDCKILTKHVGLN